MNNTITPFVSETETADKSLAIDLAYVNLASAILEEPEEVVLAAVLAHRFHEQEDELEAA